MPTGIDGGIRAGIRTASARIHDRRDGGRRAEAVDRDADDAAVLRRAGRSIAVVSPGRGSARRRDSGVALVELPQSPQNIAPSGRSAPQIRHVTTWLLSARQRTR